MNKLLCKLKKKHLISLLKCKLFTSSEDILSKSIDILV